MRPAGHGRVVGVRHAPAGSERGDDRRNHPAALSDERRTAVVLAGLSGSSSTWEWAAGSPKRRAPASAFGSSTNRMPATACARAIPADTVPRCRLTGASSPAVDGPWSARAANSPSRRPSSMLNSSSASKPAMKSRPDNASICSASCSVTVVIVMTPPRWVQRGGARPTTSTARRRRPRSVVSLDADPPPDRYLWIVGAKGPRPHRGRRCRPSTGCAVSTRAMASRTLARTALRARSTSSPIRRDGPLAPRSADSSAIRNAPLSAELGRLPVSLFRSASSRSSSSSPRRLRNAPIARWSRTSSPRDETATSPSLPLRISSLTCTDAPGRASRAAMSRSPLLSRTRVVSPAKLSVHMSPSRQANVTESRSRVSLHDPICAGASLGHPDELPSARQPPLRPPQASGPHRGGRAGGLAAPR